MNKKFLMSLVGLALALAPVFATASEGAPPQAAAKAS